jgi:hypothetical protein
VRRKLCCVVTVHWDEAVDVILEGYVIPCCADLFVILTLVSRDWRVLSYKIVHVLLFTPTVSFLWVDCRSVIICCIATQPFGKHLSCSVQGECLHRGGGLQVLVKIWQSQSQSHFTTDDQSVSQSVLVSSPFWGTWPYFNKDLAVGADWRVWAIGGAGCYPIGSDYVIVNRGTALMKNKKNQIQRGGYWNISRFSKLRRTGLIFAWHALKYVIVFSFPAVLLYLCLIHVQ